MKLRLNQCDPDAGDWYTIVRAEHDGRQWMEPVSESGYNYSVWRMSERLDAKGSTCVEGTLAEMRALAESIRAREENDAARRCAVDARTDTVLFWSPRNSGDDIGQTTIADALDFADQVDAEVIRVAQLAE